MVGVSALCQWTVSTPVSKSIPLTKGMLGHNSGSKCDVYSMSWMSGCIVAVKFLIAHSLLTSPMENMDQYDGSPVFSQYTILDNALEIHGIAYNNHELSKEQNY